MIFVYSIFGLCQKTDITNFIVTIEVSRISLTTSLPTRRLYYSINNNTSFTNQIIIMIVPGSVRKPQQKSLKDAGFVRGPAVPLAKEE